MIWLGEKRGQLTDWATQQWVRTTGRRLTLAEHPWLDGPFGNTRLIGADFFVNDAKQRGYTTTYTHPVGLIPTFSQLDRHGTLAGTAESVRHFYEQTSNYDLDAWSEWHGLFTPFGRALALLFGRRLQQLNVPLSPLDSSRGMTSDVTAFRDPISQQVVHTAWVRKLRATGNVLYAGAYSVCTVPQHPAPCVKVVFPLPNGNAMVIMKVIPHADGSLLLRSAGECFGSPGFYFVVHGEAGTAWARYVKAMKEDIHVYPAEAGTVRADHRLWFCGIEFLRLHYRMRTKT